MFVCVGNLWFLDILDKLGVIIHFPQLPFMDGYVLNPRWLTYGVYTLMYGKRARLSTQDVIQILSQEKVIDEAGNVLDYPPAKCGLIMDAMREFKLCYSLPDKADTLIIPALLPANQPALVFDKTSALTSEFDFAVFLPRHIMPELIVKRHQEIEAEIVWQAGVVLAHRSLQARALLMVDYHARKLQVWVTGQQARDYLTLLRDEIETILQRIDIDCKEWITLPDAALLNVAQPGRSVLEKAPYSQLLAYSSRGAPEFISETGRVYDVAKVLQIFSPNADRTAELRASEATSAGNKHITINNSGTMGNITNADTILGSFNPSSSFAAAATAPTASPPRTVKIFLASSNELTADRDNFELYFRQQNDHFLEQGVYLKIVRWESLFNAMAVTRKHDEYNAALKDCDIFLSLFATKTDEYTEDEFNVAHAKFKATGRPYIFTFFKDADISTGTVNRADLQTLWAFQDRLKKLGHFHTGYKGAEHLKLQFTDQLKLLLVPNKLR